MFQGSDMTTTQPRVLVTHWVHLEVLDLLNQHCEVVGNPTRDTWSRDRVQEAARDCDAMIAFMPDIVDDAFLSRCPRLKVVAAALKGTDNFDIDACTRRGVWFTRVPDLLTVPTAELALALMLGVARKLLEGDDHIRSGSFNGWRPALYGTGLQGSTLGLIGLGAVGRAVAERAAAFGMQILYLDPASPPADWPLPHAMQAADLDGLLTRADFVLPLVHLDAHTRHMFDAATIGRMKRGAYLVNVGRGSVVNEAAVAANLAAGHLAGYAADVFEMEDWALNSRPRTIHPALLADRARTFFTPHIGSAVEQARREIALEAAQNVLDVFAGHRPRGAMNQIE
jgi:phosphonate dehydrogenase